MITFKNNEELVYVGHDVIRKGDNTFNIAKFANPNTYENIRLFCSREFDAALLNTVPVGQKVEIALHSSEYNGRTSFNLIGMTPVK